MTTTRSVPKALFFSALISLLVSAQALAAGSKPPAPPVTPGSTVQTANPVRRVVVKPVTSASFALPNGSRADFGADLTTMLQTALLQNSNFAPTDPSALGPCDEHLEVRAAVTSVELNLTEGGIRFGYSPQGELSVISSVTGSVDVNVGLISMDVSIWECIGAKCTAASATTQNTKTVQVTVKFGVDFSLIHTGATFLWRTPLADAFRKLMNQAAVTLAASTKIHELAWSAEVRELRPEVSTVVFDQGFQNRVKVGDAFTVFALTEATSTCDVFRPLAHIRATQVDAVSSQATVDQVIDPRGMQVGDRVMIRLAPK